MSPTLPGNAAASINTVPSADGTTEEATAHITRGLDLFKAGKYNRAIAALDAGTEHKRFADLADVVQADAYASLGEAWLRYGVAGVEKPALTACEKAKNHRGFVELPPDRQAATYLNRGRALRDTDRIDDAIKALKEGIAHAGFKQLKPDRQAVAKGALEMLEAHVEILKERAASPARFPVPGPQDRNR